MTVKQNKRPRILIIGSGIAGLSVAHELARQRQFDICIVDKNPIPGGKARSFRRADGNVAEHSTRIFPAAYENIFRVMKEIPFRAGSTFDNLHYGLFQFRFRGKNITVDSGYAGFFSHLWKAARIYFFFWQCGVSVFELAIFTFKVASLLWRTPENVRRYLENVSFESYVGGVNRSQAFHDVILRVSEMLVAAKREASAAVVTRVLFEFFVGPFLKSQHQRLGFATLNGPTSEQFIDPWVAELRRQGVEFQFGTNVARLTENARRVTKAVTFEGQELEADIVVCAVQHNILRVLLGKSDLAAYSGIENIAPLGEEWANGMQYFLKYIPERWKQNVGCHTVCADSPWAICYVIYSQSIWPDIELPAGIAGILSLSVSNSTNPGVQTRKAFNRCNREELLEEALYQAGLNDAKDAIAEGFIGPDLHYVKREEFLANERNFDGYGARSVGSGEFVVISDSLLYIRTPGNAAIEPGNRTELVNLYIAGEFTQTLAAMPSMEKSCESGTRCAESICMDEGTACLPSRVGAADYPFQFLRTTGFRWIVALTISGLLTGTVISFILRNRFGNE